MRRTTVGTFYPLSAFIVALYERRRANRNIFTALAEPDRLLPAERPVTTRDIVNFCQSLCEAKPLPPERQADPHRPVSQEPDRSLRRIFIAGFFAKCCSDSGAHPNPKPLKINAINTGGGRFEFVSQQGTPRPVFSSLAPSMMGRRKPGSARSWRRWSPPTACS